jgi:hypothetical protein
MKRHRQRQTDRHRDRERVRETDRESSRKTYTTTEGERTDREQYYLLQQSFKIAFTTVSTSNHFTTLKMSTKTKKLASTVSKI